jgi:hypothetical protein
MRRPGPAARAALAAALVVGAPAGCGTMPGTADPGSDAPEEQTRADTPFTQAPTYAATLAQWRSADDVNAWIGARFSYDMARAMQLSETQRQQNGGRLPILEPAAFFLAPSGVCVDLARFAVETLRAVDPGAKPAYLMIEFDPSVIAGNVLRRHWLVSFQKDGQYFFFADSKRPGHIAGPYASTQEFITAYARYRGRQVVAFRELPSYERRVRTLAVKQVREDRP